MTPEDIAIIRGALPQTMAFHHYADRESAWLLTSLMPSEAPVRALRSGLLGKLLDRPLIRPLVASGDGYLRRADTAPLARADRLADFDNLRGPVLHALEQVYDSPWLDFEISLSRWGTSGDWRWKQLSRRGGNLVLQLGFPGEHGALMTKYLDRDDRCKFETDQHPVRQDGRPTLAWARLDIDLGTGTALIEEVQSDWLRFVRRHVARLRKDRPRSRALRATQAYEAELTARYSKLWSRALLLAVLMLLRDRLGCRTVFMHQPHTGAKLKWIDGPKPPVSLYSALPRAFCFQPTREGPAFLHKPRRKHLRQLPRDKPLFWKMEFEDAAPLDINAEPGML